MAEEEGGEGSSSPSPLPYVVWYQCRSCSHLFFNEFQKMTKHLAQFHDYDLQGGGEEDEGDIVIKNNNNNNNNKGTPLPPPPLSQAQQQGMRPIKTKSTMQQPIQIKEKHMMMVQQQSGGGGVGVVPNPKSYSSSGPSAASSGAEDGEDSSPYAEENNNSMYNTKNIVTSNPSSSSAMMKKMPRLFHKNDIMPPTTTTTKNNAITISSHMKRVVPSIEELKKQLVNSNIDISEIKVKYDDEEQGHHQEEGRVIHDAEEMGDDVEGEEEGEVGEDYGGEGIEEYPSEGYGEEGMEEDGAVYYDDEDEDGEEGASTSNQSFYDNFLFGGSGDGEDYENDEESTVTPSFGIVDEVYRRASLVANSQASGSGGGMDNSAPIVRRRSFHNPCKLCKKVFPSLSMLKKHAKTHMNEEGSTLHLCKFCYEYFDSAASLSKHLRVHADQNPNVCDVCNKSFTSWATLRTHLKIHSGERPFGCDVCGQRFQTKSTLDSHLRIHSGSRPHLCTLCGKSFRTSSPLYRHMRSVHKGQNIAMGAIRVNS